MPNKTYKIVTIGDSLTEGSGRQSVLSQNPSMPNTYQHYLYYALKKKGIDTEIHNFGIGGQVINQICERFSTTVPADIIITMGGTNDVWRFSEAALGVEKDMAEDILEQYKSSIDKAVSKQKSMGKPEPLVIINSIPPIGNVTTVPKNMFNCLMTVNATLQDYVKTVKNPKLMYCDTHVTMAGKDHYMRPGLFVPDGVHFTEEGNRACGEGIAQFLFKILN